MLKYENIIDRIISVLTYLTYGFIGFIYFIFCVILKKTMSIFLIYNIMQSIFLSMFIYISFILINMLKNFLLLIPIVNKIINIIDFALTTPIYYSLSLNTLIWSLVVLYLVIMSMMGRMPKLPWISKIVLNNVEKI